MLTHTYFDEARYLTTGDVVILRNSQYRVVKSSSWTSTDRRIEFQSVRRLPLVGARRFTKTYKYDYSFEIVSK